MGPDGVDVLLLGQAFGGDATAFGRDVDGIEQNILQPDRLIPGENPNGRKDVAGVYGVASPDDFVQFLEKPFGQAAIVGLPRPSGCFLAWCVQVLLDKLNSIVLAVKKFDRPGIFELDSRYERIVRWAFKPVFSPSVSSTKKDAPWKRKGFSLEALLSSP
jgi:hypothetical protein